MGISKRRLERIEKFVNDFSKKAEKEIKIELTPAEELAGIMARRLKESEHSKPSNDSDEWSKILPNELAAFMARRLQDNKARKLRGRRKF